MQRLMNTTERKLFLTALEKHYPDPRCELNWQTPFELITAIILSAQSTDKSVNKATSALFAAANTPEKVLRLGPDGLAPYLAHINYHNNKAKSLVNLSAVLLEKYQGQIPRDIATLETLPGIGHKTARVFLNVLDKAAVIGVDTHVFRLANRLGFCHSATPAETETKLDKLITGPYKSKVALALVLLGRYICKAQKPLCAACPLYDVCIAQEKKR